MQMGHGSASGVVLIEFDSPEAVDAAVGLSGAVIAGQAVLVYKGRPFLKAAPTGSAGLSSYGSQVVQSDGDARFSTGCIVENLPAGAGVDVLRSTFGGKCTTCRYWCIIMRHPYRAARRGCACNWRK